MMEAAAGGTTRMTEMTADDVVGASETVTHDVAGTSEMATGKVVETPEAATDATPHEVSIGREDMNTNEDHDPPTTQVVFAGTGESREIPPPAPSIVTTPTVPPMHLMGKAPLVPR